MSLTIQQILQDAKKLSNKLKEHDSAADVILSQTQTVYKRIDAMKQYKDEVTELNEAARQRPHSVLIAGIQQESRHLRELQQENRELKAALEEHQNALELIMSKYRQQVTQLIDSSKPDINSLYDQQYTQLIEKQADKIAEMAAVMKIAAEVDDRNGVKDESTMVQLATENKGLRELLDISMKFGSTTAEKVKSEKDEVKIEEEPAEVKIKEELNEVQTKKQP